MLTKKLYKNSKTLNEIFNAPQQLKYYFPQRREGQFWVLYELKSKVEGESGQPVVHAFGDKITAKNAEATLLEDENVIKKSVRIFEDGGKALTATKSKSELSVTAFAELQRNIIKSISSATRDKKLDPKARDEIIESLSNDLAELYVKNSPTANILKTALIRRDPSKLGATGDVLDVFNSSARPLAQQLARFKNAQDIDVGLRNLSESIKDVKDIDTQSDYRMIERAVRGIVDEAKHSSLSETARYIHNTLGQYGFLWYLGNLASITQNLFQLGAYTFTMLSARFGAVDSGAAILKAIYDIKPILLSPIDGGRDVKPTEYKYTDRDGNVTTTHERLPISDNLTKDEREALVRATAEGTVSRVMVGDVGGLNIEELSEKELRARGKYTPAEIKKYLADGNIATGTLAQLNRPVIYLAHGFGKVERFNREVTFLAAYRLAKKSPKKLKIGPLGGAARFSTPFDYATELTLQSQGNYSNQGWGVWFQGGGLPAGAGRTLLMFKKYPLLMLDIFFDSIRRTEGLQSIYPFDKSVRRKEKLTMEEQEEATRMAGNLIIGNLAMFGVNGLPLFAAVMALYSAAMYKFHDEEEDGPWVGLDANKIIKDAIDDFFQLQVSRGLIEESTGLAVSERGGIGGPMFFPPRYTDDMGIVAQTGEVLGGPMIGLGLAGGSVIGKWVERYKTEGVQLGNIKGYLRDLEPAAPGQVRYGMQAYRINEEGLRDPRGDTLIAREDFKNLGWTVLAKAWGYNTKEIKEVYDLRSSRIEALDIIRNEKNTIVGRLQSALENGNTERYQEAVKEAAKFNRIYGEQAGATIIDVRKVFSTYKGKLKRGYKRRIRGTLGVDPRGVTRFEKIDRLRGRERLNARDRREEMRRRRREKEEED